MRLLSNKTILCYHIEVKKIRKLGKVQKLQQLPGSCEKGLPEGCSRAGEGEGPEAGRKRAGHFADACPSKKPSLMDHPPTSTITEQESTVDGIIKQVDRSVHRSEHESFLLTEVIQISYLGNWSCRLIPDLSSRSVGTNLTLVWRWQVILD